MEQNQITYGVCELFTSINGEAQAAGELACFIRFAGCNLRCSYCDTLWANAPDAAVMHLTADELCSRVRESGVHNVTLTGGEPLLQPEIGELIAKLGETGCRVEIETNGSVSLAPFAGIQPRPCFTLDYKLPSSGMEQHMLTDHYRYLNRSDTVKFVSGSRDDLERAREIISTYSLTDRCKVYLSPVFGRIEPKEMVEFMKEYKLCGVRLQLQLHKFIWPPDERGV